MKIELGHRIKAAPEPQLFELTQWGVRMPNGRTIWSDDIDKPFVQIPGTTATSTRLSGAKGTHEMSLSIEDAADQIRNQMIRLGNAATEPPFTVIERKATIVIHPAEDSARQVSTPASKEV